MVEVNGRIIWFALAHSFIYLADTGFAIFFGSTSKEFLDGFGVVGFSAASTKVDDALVGIEAPYEHVTVHQQVT